MFRYVSRVRHELLSVCILIIEGISWDWVNEKMYWTDSCEDEIEVFDPATQQRRVLTSTGSSPFAIVVDPGTG